MSDLDPYAPFAALASCENTPKPGVKLFRDMMLTRWGGEDLGIARACVNGPTSKHHEGRAWDWRPPSKQAGDAAIADLLASTAAGDHELARRAGLRTIIWYGRIWVSAPPYEWKPYDKSPHTDHVHFGFGWPGAMAQTTLYGPAPGGVPLWPFRSGAGPGGGDGGSLAGEV